MRWGATGRRSRGAAPRPALRDPGSVVQRRGGSPRRRHGAIRRARGARDAVDLVDELVGQVIALSFVEPQAVFPAAIERAGRRDRLHRLAACGAGRALGGPSTRRLPSPAPPGRAARRRLQVTATRRSRDRRSVVRAGRAQAARCCSADSGRRPVRGRGTVGSTYPGSSPDRRRTPGRTLPRRCRATNAEVAGPGGVGAADRGSESGEVSADS